MTETVMKPTEFNVEDVTYTDIRPMGNTGGKQMYLNYQGNKRIVLHTPKMRLPYGLGKYEEEGKATKYSLDLSFKGMEEDESMKEFYEKMHNLDEKIIADAKKNSLAWLRKKSVSEDVLRTLYIPSIKLSKDKETGEPDGRYPPTLKAKIGYKFGTDYKELDPPVWMKKGKDKEKLEGDWTGSVHKGQTVRALLKCGGLWFSGGKFGVTWKVAQMLLDEPKGLVGYAFRDCESDEEDA